MFNFVREYAKRRRFRTSVFICVHLWMISLCLFAFPPRTKAQIRPVYDQGALGLGQLLKRLNTTASALMIGAHPDDEDTALLAYLARGESARTAYLSLTRGDGGQNIIGPELGEALGVIRTEELLQARKLDGAEQYFTRAYDYGFSKTLDEAKQKWDEKIILCDVVRVIRNFRPLVVISQFSGTPADGHGQHQFAGYITPLALKAAADPAQCSDTGPAWLVKKFYVRHGFRATGEPKLRINTGKYDPLLGRSYFEIAMEARSQHKSQEQGVLELKGDQFSGLNLVASSISKATEELSIFDGLDISAAQLGSKISNSVTMALKEYDPTTSDRIVPLLVEGYYENLHGLVTLGAGGITWDDGVPYTPPDPKDEKNRVDALSIVRIKHEEYVEAIRKAAGIRIDALADKDTVSPDESFQVAVKIFFPGSEIKVVEVTLAGMPSVQVDGPGVENQSPFRRETSSSSAYFRVSVPKESVPTQPYWLQNERKGDLFTWKEGNYLPATPFQPPLLMAVVVLDVAGKRMRLLEPVEYRYADDIRGEVRLDLNIVPPVSVSLDQELLIVPSGVKSETRRIVMNITNNSSRAVGGIATLDIDSSSGLKSLTAAKPFELKSKGEKKAIAFDLTIPPRTKEGSYRITGQAKIGDKVYSQQMNTIAYPHIQTHRFYTEAQVTVNVLDLKVSPVRVGYLKGSGDGIPDAIGRLGMTVEPLTDSDLGSGDLSKFDVIVVGVRASQVRPDFASEHLRLLDYVRNGGTLIVQYQRTDYERFLPFPAKMGPRVADENAKVTILQPDHSSFNIPNKITEEDFKGWVQERNLYNFSTMDAKYVGLLESHDPGEAENKGGLVIADIGKGKYIYCSYSLFRQLPAGVPGAYRLLANMLSISSTRPARK